MLEQLRAVFSRKGYEKRPKVYILGAAVTLVVVYIAYTSFGKSDAEALYTLSKVEKETITTYVSAAGQVVVKNQIDLKPQSSNNITSIRVSVGQSVKQGQVLATLDQRATLIGLKQSEASLLSAKASFKKVSDGATENDLLSLQSALDNSKISLTTSKQNAVTKINEVYTQVSDIITTKTNVFFLTPNTSPTLSIPGYPLNNQVLQSSIDLSRREFNTELPLWKSRVNTLSVNGDVSGELKNSLEVLQKTATYLDGLLSALNANTASDSTVNGYRSTVSSARSTVSSLISSIIVTEQSIASAESSLRQAQASYDAKKEPPTAEDITIAQASLTNAEAGYLNAQNNYANTVITAPFDAVVGAVNGRVGDQSSAGTAMFTLITSNQLADISFNEVDATKIKVGQKATLTFDAVPELVIAGTVSEVSPLGAVSSGVVSYGVKVSLDTKDDRIKPGMSVNANIITGIRENVLAVPNEAVKLQARSSYIEVPTSLIESSSSTLVQTLPEGVRQSVVTVGVSNDTTTEIVSGIEEGEWIVTKTVTQTTSDARTAQQSGFSALGGGGARGLGR